MISLSYFLILGCFTGTGKSKWYCPDRKSSWGQHGAHLGPTGPRWAPCWLRELCYLSGFTLVGFGCCKTTARVERSANHHVTSYGMKALPHYKLFVRGPPSTGGLPSQRVSNADLFVLHLNERLNKQSNFRWFGTRSHSCDVIVIMRMSVNIKWKNKYS